MELAGVDDGDDGGHVVAGGGLRPRCEETGDGSGLGDARRLDDEVVEPPFPSEADDGGFEVVPQFTADAAVREFGHAAVDGEVRVPAHEVGVDVDVAHVVDEDGDVAVVRPGEQVVEQRRLAGAEAPAQDGDGDGVAVARHASGEGADAT